MAEIEVLAKRIRTGAAPWVEVNALVSKIYALSAYDQQLIADAVAHEAPYPATLAAAVTEVERDGAAVKGFTATLASILSEVEGAALYARPYAVSNDDGPWQFVRLGIDTREPDAVQVQQLLKLAADPLQVSEVRLQLGDKNWLIGRIRYARYWTRSQARLLALDLIDAGLFSSAAFR